MKSKENTWKNIDKGTIEIDDVQAWDYPDFCDAFISYAEYEDGTEASEEDIEQWVVMTGDTFSEMVLEECY
tara:strand:- start:434 stop:646 length:213 start_codon:yes stop_codon:yes gene_type:complete